MSQIEFPYTELDKSELLERLSEFFSAEHLENLARKTKMVQRSTSRLSGKMFVILNSLFIQSLDQVSLSDQCEFLSDYYGVRLTKQSLDERYNTDAVRFMRAVFSELLAKVLIQPQGLSSITCVFKRIYVEDSTSFQLSGQLATFYKSAGGATSGSSIKLHLAFELISGIFSSISVADGRTNDAKFLDQKPLTVKSGDLILRDLGYLKHEELSRIHQNGAYFICRYKAGTHLYEKTADGRFQVADLEAYLEGVTTLTSKWLYYGQAKLPVRFIVVPVSKQKANQARKKLSEKLRKNKNWKTNSLRWKMCDYHLFICNFDLEVTDQQVLLLYSLRWQIELFFKISKSTLKLNQAAQVGNIFRFECFLYGRLIALCLSQNIFSLFRQHLLDFDFELSELKAFRTLKKRP